MITPLTILHDAIKAYIKGDLQVLKQVSDTLDYIEVDEETYEMVDSSLERLVSDLITMS